MRLKKNVFFRSIELSGLGAMVAIQGQLFGFADVYIPFFALKVWSESSLASQLDLITIQLSASQLQVFIDDYQCTASAMICITVHSYFFFIKM